MSCTVIGRLYLWESNSPVTNKNREKDATCESTIHCYLCGLISTRAFAHWLPTKPPLRHGEPYFPKVPGQQASARSEPLRDDGSALVCTFCYHMVHSQWKQYEDAPASKSLVPLTRVYNTHDYTCYVCSIATYRKRVRALPVKVGPPNQKFEITACLMIDEYVLCMFYLFIIPNVFGCCSFFDGSSLATVH